MSSFNLSRKYRPMAGTNFFARQVDNAAHAIMNVARDVAAKKTGPASTALPTDIPSADKPKSKMPLIIGGVAGAAVLVLILSGRKRSASPA